MPSDSGYQYLRMDQYNFDVRVRRKSRLPLLYVSRLAGTLHPCPAFDERFAAACVRGASEISSDNEPEQCIRQRL